MSRNVVAQIAQSLPRLKGKIRFVSVTDEYVEGYISLIDCIQGVFMLSAISGGFGENGICFEHVADIEFLDCLPEDVMIIEFVESFIRGYRREKCNVCFDRVMIFMRHLKPAPAGYEDCYAVQLAFTVAGAHQGHFVNYLYGWERSGTGGIYTFLSEAKSAQGKYLEGCIDDTGYCGEGKKLWQDVEGSIEINLRSIIYEEADGVMSVSYDTRPGECSLVTDLALWLDARKEGDA